MWMSTTGQCNLLVATLLMLTVVPAAAQPAGGPVVPPTTSSIVTPTAGPSWLKTCGMNKTSKEELCTITEELRSDSGTLIVSVSLRQVSGDKKTLLLATAPLGMLLKPGLKLQVDEAKPLSLAYGVCDTQSCYGVGEAASKLLAHMRNGKELVLTTYNRQGEAVLFKLPLAGFDAAFAGKGLTPEELQELQRTRANALKAKADLAREALLREQRKNGVD